VSQYLHAIGKHAPIADTKRLKAWLRAGKTVELRERDRVIARIVPENEHGPKKDVKWPDFNTIAKEIIGDRVFPNLILEDRGRY
jgi:antitoxin (DNA-binding transcriptional repressor) of toxin-antitoxin stability system